MSENLESISKDQFIDRLIYAITSKKKETFDELTQIGVIWFGEEELANILNKVLPLKLETSEIPILLKYMGGEKEYINIVQSLLAEIIQVLNEENFELGEDFSYGEIDGVPSLWIKRCYLEKIKNIYDLSSWKQCEPFIKVLEKS